MGSLLSRIESPADLRTLTDDELCSLAQEIRETLCQPLESRSVHFASNLGVVELTLALHLTFDFARDRLIWDTGHQIYPHKLITGRHEQFASIRTRGGLMGYPNPDESPYDLFMTGHAGCSVSTALGLKMGDELMGRPERKSVAVIGDGAFPSGIVYEAMNNAAELNRELVVVLNDNQMSICPRVGGVAKSLDKARMAPMFHDVKCQLDEALHKLPLVGHSFERAWTSLKDMVKAGVYGGMLFEQLGFQYVGPVDGHDIKTLREYLQMVKEQPGPTLLHVLTEKGHGIASASEDPVTFHTPPVFEKVENGVISLRKSKSVNFTNLVSDAIREQLASDKKVCVMTAAMCQGNKLERSREEFPDQFFDTGICESHAVAFAAGMAKVGARPIVAIYSTFLQRSFDQIFQEVALQNLPVTFCLDRAGFTGPDGPTHHGTFDIPYMRIFPNMVVMAPGDASDVQPMLEFALKQDCPVSLRYPKAAPAQIERAACPIEMGQAEVYEWGTDGCIIAIGSMFGEAVEAAEILREEGFDVGVINARFIKPLDKRTILKAVSELPFVMTVEEGTVVGGFGSAVLEAACEEGIAANHVYRCGIPDDWILHAERKEQLAEVGIDAPSLAAKARELAALFGPKENSLEEVNSCKQVG
ncbi:1-deoxy-D-xylulose-5-phosphate synthase [Planctomycetes bacterium Pan216]|uniref:1-deoxy-D-xylulose-5-phosphate synthase n=1 Tax=Kolteria novifilia TaxID=2527975 RepID=A0A518B832_9BACT|nr:1-deoxy-D-xylulose-5-phosphate synthase [Planctomycetes bacterium Pan216]